MQFPGYFLIVSDFIKWAKSHDIPVGPGRGSGAGSVVAWALTITDLDPLRWGLLFERFLNPERVSMPDFDIDFCQERRGEVIDYVANKYGADRVAQIITFGTLQARAVLRDVGRVMQLPFHQVDKLAKLVPANPANPVTLAQAMEIEPKLSEARKNEAEVRDLIDTALELEGLYRNASTHAAGVVIGDRPLQDLVALYRDPRSDMPATQFNMKWVEQAGLVKFDFLGLKTLDVIDRALKFLKARGIIIDINDAAFDDEATYKLMQSGLTFGVFQLEGQGMRDTLRKVKPTCLEDVIALISLYRPGPMKNIDRFANVKHDREQPDYLHETLKPILEETYGVIVYQEQVMQIAQVLSGYSLGEADLLRRAMGKKQPAEMKKQKTRFIEGAKERGVNENLASHIFDLVEEFAGYGFNKSHAAAYAVIAYQTAYLKAHYPVDFLAASMSLDISNSDKLASFAQDAKRIGVQVLAPDLNFSEADFSVEQTEDGVAVRYALGAVRNVGVAAMESIVRRTQGTRSVQGALRFRRTNRSESREPPPARESRQSRRLRLDRTRSRPRFGRLRNSCRLRPACRRGKGERSSEPVRRRRAKRAACFPESAGLVGARQARRRTRERRLLSLRPPALEFLHRRGRPLRDIRRHPGGGRNRTALVSDGRRRTPHPVPPRHVRRHAGLHLHVRSHRRFRSAGDARVRRAGARDAGSRQALRLSRPRALARRRSKARRRHL